MALERLDAGAGRAEMLDAWLRMAAENNFTAQSSLTMTFDRTRGVAITPERALWEWRYLVRRLNGLVGGGNYRRKWGHSYFGYIFAVERHKDGVFHAHAVVDNWISFRLAHDVWVDRCGWFWSRIVGDSVQATRYVLKYILKSDIRPTYYFCRERREINPRTGAIFRAGAASQA